MDQAVIASKVVETIEELTNEGRIFTAFDVTKMIRAQEGVVGARHAEFRDAVQAAFASQEFPANYKRTLCSVSGNRTWVYHLDHEDPNAYDPDEIPYVQVTDDVGTDPDPVVSNGKHSLTSADRLNVSNDLLSQIGAKHNDFMWISAEGNKLTLSLKVNQSGPNPGDQKHLVVNGDGRVRISKKIIEEYLTCVSPTSYDIEVENDYITVSPVSPGN